LEEKGSVKGKNIVLLGAGGSARAIVYEAIQRGANVRILNRTKDRALSLTQEFNCESGGLEDLSKKPFSIIINATPSLPEIDYEQLHPDTIAMDLQIRPKDTPFLIEAEKRGCQLVYGYEMFTKQAMGQFQIWFEREMNWSFLENHCPNHPH
jgi:3-dehydroquinate dehydratase/shikimate dehydrogenase